MDTYNSMTETVLSYLKDHEYCSSLIKTNERCFNKLEKYLAEHGIDYTPEAALEWFGCEESLALSDKAHGRVALTRLKDVFETGTIRIEHDTRHLMSYSILTDQLRDDLEEYLLHISQTLSKATVDNHRHSCAKFLIFAQKHGVQRVNDVTAEMLIDFYHCTVCFGQYNNHTLNSHVSLMMGFLYKKGEVSYSCALILHYLSHGELQGCYWNQVSQAAHAKITDLMQKSETADVRILSEYKEKLAELHRDSGYSKTVINTNNKGIDLLSLFLEMNGYQYSPEIAAVWFEELRPMFKTQAFSIYRALCLVADCHCTSTASLEKVYRTKRSIFYQLPAWCMGPAENYVEEKVKEGWEESTLSMIRSSITRFCTFLDSLGIRSFQEINVSHIKSFNTFDQHKTPQGKNAYNGRIRKFLFYLGEHQYLTNPMIFTALACTNAPKETIVVVLTEEEMKDLHRVLNTDDSGLSLRKKAMLLLGLKMGLRSIDVVNLTIDDIDWTSASIRFVQKKTSVEVCLPMPAEVGNALFRYITEERGAKASSQVFLSEKAPRRPVGRAVCRDALITALPDRKVQGSGFHVMRKTYATTLLNNGVGADMVAEALGQRGTASVGRYLSLDVGRMRLCALSLEECGIGGWDSEK